MNRTKKYTVDGDVVQYKEVMLNTLDLNDLYKKQRIVKRDMEMCVETNQKLINEYNNLQDELNTINTCIIELGGKIEDSIEVIE